MIRLVFKMYFNLRELGNERPMNKLNCFQKLNENQYA